MATIDELPLWLRATLKLYPWRRVDRVPCTPLQRPIPKSRVALVTTAGLVPAGQPPFDESIKHQTVGLIQAELERQGITTASITMLPEITHRVRPPRALAVPYPLGYPLGVPAVPGVQLSVLRALMSLCRRDDVPLLEHFDPNG